jgi:subtilisin family serine protease
MRYPHSHTHSLAYLAWLLKVNTPRVAHSFIDAPAGNQGRSMMSSSPANCPDTLAVTSVSDYDGLPGGLGTPANETDLDDTYTDFSNWGSTSTAGRTIAGPGEGLLAILDSSSSSSTMRIVICTCTAGCTIAGPGELHVAGQAPAVMQETRPAPVHDDAIIHIRSAA